MNIVRAEISSTFHARFEYMSVKNTPFKPTETRNRRNLLFPWGTWTPN